MSKRIGLDIGGRRFDLDVEDDFAVFLEKKMAQDFDIEANNDLKFVLQAYVKQIHELYTLEKKLEKILEQIQ